MASASGLDPGLTTMGTLVVARDHDDTGELGELHLIQQAAGLIAERVTSREARRLEPALGPAVRGGLWLPDDHQVDNRALLRALKQACDRAAVGFVAERACAIAPAAVTVGSGAVIPADVVVVATGAWSPPLSFGDAPLAIPVRPVKGQILRVRATPTAVCPSRTVRGVDVYIVPRASGEIVIGATSEEKGFDTTVTAGGVMDLLRDAWELCPGVAEAEFVEAIAGLRPGTPDNVPLIGWWGPGSASAGDACLLAMGHYRHGVLLAPITADAVTASIFGPSDGPPLDADRLAGCDPMRFATPVDAASRDASTAAVQQPIEARATALSGSGGAA